MPIGVEETARIKMKELLADRPAGTFVRLRAIGGGCSGFKYELDFDMDFNPQHDRVEFDDGETRVIVDKKSFIVAHDATINFETRGLASGFTVTNPHAKNTCGCGRPHSL